MCLCPFRPGYNTKELLARMYFFERIQNWRTIIIVLCVKWTKMVEIRYKDLINVIPFLLHQISWWVMTWRIHGEGTTQIPLNSTAMIGPVAKDPGSKIDRVYTGIKIANNTKINHKIISCIDHYNVISLDRFPSKTKIRKY